MTKLCRIENATSSHIPTRAIGQPAFATVRRTSRWLDPRWFVAKMKKIADVCHVSTIWTFDNLLLHSVENIYEPDRIVCIVSLRCEP